MKHASHVLVIAAYILFAGCSGEGIISPELATGDGVDVTDVAKDLGRSNGTVTVPFKAMFYTDGGIVPGDNSCGAPPFFLNVQDGDGEATHLGRFSTHMTFCVDATDILDDGQLSAGESAPYDNGVGTLTAANGDELWITIAGAVLPSGHPDFDYEFADPFAFSGGTGRFEGASGGGYTNSYVHAAIGRTIHEWSGTLILPRVP